MKPLFHPRKGILTHVGKNFSPLKGMQEIYADKSGKNHTLDGTEIPVENILKQHQKNQLAELEKNISTEDEWKKIEEEEIKKIAEIDKISHQEQKKEQEHKDILSEIKNASEAIVEAVEAIPETVIPEIKIPDHYAEQAKWQNEVLEVLKREVPEAEYAPVVAAIREIKFPEIPQPINYMEALVAIKKALPKEQDNTELINAIQNIRFPEFPEQPPFSFKKNGALRVSLDEMAVATGNGASSSVSQTGFGIPAYDSKIIDETAAPGLTVITYKKSGNTVAVENIVVSGAITTISVTL